ncbi:MAG: DUF131 domain-containing protein [Fervidicoccaceae archaeon]
MWDKLVFIGFITIMIGIALIIIGSIISVLRASSEENMEVEAGGVVFIGPIPIVFGTNKQIAWYMLLTAVVLAILMIVMLYITRKII